MIAAGFYMFFYTGIEVLLPIWVIKGLGLPVYWVGILLAIELLSNGVFLLMVAIGLRNA